MASITAFTATNLLKYHVISISAPGHVRHKLVSQTASDKSNIAVKQHSFLPRVKQYWLASPYCTISYQNELGQEWAKIMWNFLSSWVWLSLEWVFTWLLQIIDWSLELPQSCFTQSLSTWCFLWEQGPGDSLFVILLMSLLSIKKY